MSRSRCIIFLLVFCLTSPLYADHTVKFNFNLEVFEKGAGGEPDRYLAFTREEGPHKVDVPNSSMWYIRPIGRYSDDDFNRLMDAVKSQGLPGLSLSNRWDVSNDTLKGLEGTSSLTILLLGNTRVTNEGLSSLAQLSHLECLSLPRQITDEGLSNLSALKSLKTLNLSRSKITDKGLTVLAQLPHLESLNLSGTRITDDGAKVLGTIKSLKQLDISETAITDQGVKDLARCSNLEVLYLNKHLTDEGLAGIASLSKLKTLDLSGSQITSDGLVTLKKLSHLQELALSGTRVDDAGMRYVTTLSELRVLELSDTQISSEGMMALGSLSRLETLSVSWDELSEGEWQVLAQLKHLTVVILNGSRMAPDALNQTLKMAKTHKGIQVVASLPQHYTPTPSVAPGHAPVSIEEGGQTLQEAPRPVPSGAYNSPQMPPDLEPPPDQKSPISTEVTPNGPGMNLDVAITPKKRKASSTVMHLVGLKRVHEVEYEESAGGPDMDLVDNAKAAPTDVTPAQSVGEINVGVSPSPGKDR